MTITIIKRDGTRQPYDAGKMTRWGRWAAENLGERIDWASVLVEVASELPSELTSAQLQYRLIDKLIMMKSWPAYLMAGRLYAPQSRKEIYGTDQLPSIQDVHSWLAQDGFMRVLNYTDADYAQINDWLQHDRDLTYPHFQLEQLRRKYALRNRSKRKTATGRKEYETPQFTYMRMAMALAEDAHPDRRMDDAHNLYELFSLNQLNPPTPNYVNLGTNRHGYASCCLIASDDQVRSLHAGDVIAYAMTYSSAGIGAYINTRNVGDPVDGGRFEHQGRFRYYKAHTAAVGCNSQAGRGGASNVFYEIFHPQVEMLARLKNQRTPEARRNRDADFTPLTNKFFAGKVARNEQMFTFTSFNAPDLYAAFFSPDTHRFAELYAKYEQDATFHKTWVNARDLYLILAREAYETGRNYEGWIDEINRHTSFRDTIHSSNLCMEIVQPTQAYENVQQLYDAYPHAITTFRVGNDDYSEPRSGYSVGAIQIITPEGRREWRALQNLKVGDRIVDSGRHDNPYRASHAQGSLDDLSTEPEPELDNVITKIEKQEIEPEVSLCSIAGAIVSNIPDDETYEKVMYYAYYMIDKCIHLSHYELPHIGWSAKQRLNAGVGIMDLAQYMARRGLRYDSLEGKAEVHRLAERHLWFAIKASCRLAQELGPAPWAHRAKWIDGWTPVDTYNRNVDSIGEFAYQYDWVQASQMLQECGGGRFSSLVAHMPGESSSKGAGICNSVYPIREAAILKSDATQLIYWAAPDGDILPYQSAWDIATKDMTDVYAILQKFCDQAISADEWRRIGPGELVPSSEIIQNYLYRGKMGVKTRYYLNTHTSKQVTLNDGSVATVSDENINSGANCGSGGCAL